MMGIFKEKKMNRSFAFFGGHRAAVAMDEQDLSDHKKLTFALALCCGRDHFNKKVARDILNGRLDDRLAGNPTRLTWQVDYFDEHPRRDAMAPMMDLLRELPEKRDYDVIRYFKSQLASAMANFRITQDTIREANAVAEVGILTRG